MYPFIVIIKHVLIIFIILLENNINANAKKT